MIEFWNPELCIGIWGRNEIKKFLSILNSIAERILNLKNNSKKNCLPLKSNAFFFTALLKCALILTMKLLV